MYLHILISYIVKATILISLIQASKWSSEETQELF